MASERFNTYYDHIDQGFWRELCVREGVLRHYDKGEAFAERGYVSSTIVPLVADISDLKKLI